MGRLSMHLVRMRRWSQEYVRPLFARIPELLRKHATLSWLVGSLAMVSIQEYAVALILVTLALVAALIELKRWHGIAGHALWTQLARGVLLAASVIVAIFFAAAFWAIKDKNRHEWSNVPYWLNSPVEPADVPPFRRATLRPPRPAIAVDTPLEHVPMLNPEPKRTMLPPVTRRLPSPRLIAVASTAAWRKREDGWTEFEIRIELRNESDDVADATIAVLTSWAGKALVPVNSTFPRRIQLAPHQPLILTTTPSLDAIAMNVFRAKEAELRVTLTAEYQSAGRLTRYAYEVVIVPESDGVGGFDIVKNEWASPSPQ